MAFTRATKVPQADGLLSISQSHTVPSSKTEVPTDPIEANSPHIPRPPNAFFIFRADAIVQHNLREIEHNQRNVSRIVSRLWHALPDAEKSHYRRAAEVKRLEHQLAHPDYQSKPRNRIKSKVKGGKRSAHVKVDSAVAADAELVAKYVESACKMTINSPEASSGSYDVLSNEHPAEQFVLELSQYPVSASTPSSRASCSYFGESYHQAGLLTGTSVVEDDLPQTNSVLLDPTMIRNEPLTEEQLLKLMECFN